MIWKKRQATVAQLSGKPYANIIDKNNNGPYGLLPKQKDGKNWTTTRPWRGDDLTDFVNTTKSSLTSKNSKQVQKSADTIEYKIGEIFSELKK